MTVTALQPRVRFFLEQRAWTVVLLITAVGFLLRIDGFDTYWINADEGIYFSMTAWSDASRFWAEWAGNAHPPLYYLLLRGIGSLTHDFAWLRSVSLVAGCIAIPATAWLAREAAGHDFRGVVCGWLAALAIALSENMIVMSEIMRPYALLLASLTAAAAFLLRWMRVRGTRSATGYATCLVIAILTHYSALLVAAGFGICTLVWLAKQRFARQSAIAVALANAVPLATVILLWFFHLRPLAASSLAKDALATWLQPFLVNGWPDVLHSSLGFFAFVFGATLAGPALLACIAGFAVAAVRKQTSIVLLPASVLALSLIAAALGKYPFGCSRHATYLTSFLVIPIAWLGATAVTSRARTAGLALLTAGAAVAAGTPIGEVLGSEATTMVAVREQVLRRADIDRVSSVWNKIETTPGIVLIDTQTYFMLMPFVYREREQTTWSDARRHRTFVWGKRTCLVMNDWSFTLDPRRANASNHLREFLLYAATAEPGLDLLHQHRLLMIFAGWSSEVPTGLSYYDRQVPPELRFMRDRYDAPGFSAFEFDVAAFEKRFGSAF